MRILLVNPPAGRKTRGLKDIVKLEPLALEILGGALPGHDVEILDLQFGPLLGAAEPCSKLERRLREFRPDLVGVGTTASHTYRTHELLRTTKAHDPDIYTVVGGQHATLCPGEFHARHVDAIVRGLGPQTFRELVEHLEAGDSPEEVAGLALPTPSGLRRTPARERPPDLGGQPLPDRSLTRPNRSDYYYTFVKPAALVRTSQGCTYGCNFCSVRQFTDRHFLPQPVDRLIQDLHRVQETFVYFADDHSFLNPGRMYEIADRIEDSRIHKRYLAYTRVDAVVRNPDLFRRWSEIGLDAVMMGVEAVEDRHLEAMNKNVTADDNERALEILDDCGVGVSAGFVVMPDFTEEDFQRIDRFVGRHSNILTAELTPYTPLPGTPLYDRVEDQLEKKHRELFDLTHFVLPTELPPERLQELIRKYYHRILSRAIYRLTTTHPTDMLRLHTFRVLARLLKTSADYGETHLDAEVPEYVPSPDAGDAASDAASPVERAS